LIAVEEIIETFNSNGRQDASKVLLLITDKEVKKFSRIAGVTTLILSVNALADK